MAAPEGSAGLWVERPPITFAHTMSAVLSSPIHETIVLGAKRTSATLPLSVPLLLFPALHHSSFMPANIFTELTRVKNTLSCGEDHEVGWAGVLWAKLLQLVFSPKPS